ncbi:MAG TPA: DUF692 domain-containing protein [Aeromonadales bacterium]|nr:DUF692 domain-containing protein [Aeromonadales bacterium]
MTTKLSTRSSLQGAGLGFRREMLDSFDEFNISAVDFLEVAPENWLPVGGLMGRQFQQFTEKFPFVLHGLSLSIGGPAPLDEPFIRSIKAFMDKHQIELYSEHLSYCGDDGHLYDLMPIPFTEEAVEYVSARIRRVQEIIERPLIMENVSYYAAPGQEMDEISFITQIMEKADCRMLLDVNNVYVNSVNHRYDAKSYIDAMPTERISYLHMAGHFDEAEDLLVDTHGDDVKDTVWDLLTYTYEKHGVFPTLLERDFNIPPLNVLLREVDKIKQIQRAASTAVPETNTIPLSNKNGDIALSATAVQATTN